MPQKLALKTLGEVHISDVLKNKKVTELYTITSEASITEALQQMRHCDIASLAVSDGKSYAGIVNVFDLMNYVIGFVKSTGSDGAQVEFDTSHFNDPITNALGLSLEGRVVYNFDKDDMLQATLDAFALGVHRILVSDKSAELPTRMMTQTDVAKYILEHLSEFAINAAASVAEIGLFEEPGTGVLTISNTEAALRGFNKIALNEVSAVAVVDSDGKLVGTLSASDVRGMTDLDINDLALPVLDFLKKRPHIHKQQIVVHSNAPVRDALVKMTDLHVHRVWVVDAQNKPRGVITMSDIIRKVAQAKPISTSLHSH